MRLTATLLAAGACFAQGPVLPPNFSYLELTPVQIASVMRQNQTYNAHAAGLRVRENLALNEVAKETAASPLHPPALGARWVDLLTLRREANSALRDAITANRALLTDTQREKLKTLEDASALTPSISLLQSLYFLPPPCSLSTAQRWFDSTDFVAFPGNRLGFGCPAATIGVIGENPYYSISVWPALRQFLELTDAQLNRLSENSIANDQWVALKWERVGTVHRELAEETARETLDAIALGLRYTELEVIRREILAEYEKFLRSNQAVLTAAQRVKFAQLEEAARLAPALNDARGIGLLKNDCPQQVIALPFPSREGCATGVANFVIRDPFPLLP